MANKVKQFRYYSDSAANDTSNKKNQPSALETGPVTSQSYLFLVKSILSYSLVFKQSLELNFI